MKKMHAQQGLTLIELIISIVIIGIALAGVLSVMNLTTARSADPMIQHQALAIAEAYLEEILTKEYGGPTGATDRDEFITVGDYSVITDSVPANQLGNTIDGLGSYRVSVGVVSATINSVEMQHIDVSVSHPHGVNITLSGYRADY